MVNSPVARIAVGLLVIATATYLLTPYWSPHAMPARSAPDLSVQLSSSRPNHVKVSITNDGDNLATFLRWDTAFDEQALALGILTLTDAETGDAIPGPDLKLNRVLPPSRDDLVEVGAGGEISKELALGGFWLPKNGREVKVHAQGRWKAVWMKPKADVTEEELQAVGGEQALQGDFASEVDAEIELS